MGHVTSTIGAYARSGACRGTIAAFAGTEATEAQPPKKSPRQSLSGAMSPGLVGKSVLGLEILQPRVSLTILVGDVFMMAQTVFADCGIFPRLV